MIGAAITAAQLQGSVSCGAMSSKENYRLVGKQNQHLLTPGYTLTNQV